MKYLLYISCDLYTISSDGGHDGDGMGCGCHCGYGYGYCYGYDSTTAATTTMLMMLVHSMASVHAAMSLVGRG